MLAFLAVLAVMLAANVATNRLPDHWYVPICLAFTLLLLGLGAWAGLSAADLGVGAASRARGLAVAGGLVVATSVVYLVAAAVPKARPLFADRRAMAASRREIAYRALVAVPFGTVLLEETAFRSVLFGMAAARWSGTVAVVVTAVLFGFWHVLPALPMHESHAAVGAALGTGTRGRVTAVGLTVLGTAAAGVGFGLLRLATGSVLPPAGLHWAVNAFGLVAAWALARRPAAHPTGSR